MGTADGVQLSSMSDSDLVEFALSRERLSPLEFELAYRLEQRVENEEDTEPWE